MHSHSRMILDLEPLFNDVSSIRENMDRQIGNLKAMIEMQSDQIRFMQ